MVRITKLLFQVDAAEDALLVIKNWPDHLPAVVDGQRHMNALCWALARQQQSTRLHAPPYHLVKPFCCHALRPILAQYR